MKPIEFAWRLGAAVVGIVIAGLLMDISTSGLVLITLASAVGIAYGMNRRSR